MVVNSRSGAVARSFELFQNGLDLVDGLWFWLWVGKPLQEAVCGYSCSLQKMAFSEWVKSSSPLSRTFQKQVEKRLPAHEY